MELEKISLALKTPEALTPRDVVNMTLILSSEFGRLTEAFLQATGDASTIEADLLMQPEMTSAKAKVLTAASDAGKRRMIFGGRLKAIEQTIQALKKTQAYFSENKYN